MNVDKNIFGWTYCLLKYGDVYLRLYRESAPPNVTMADMPGMR